MKVDIAIFRNRDYPGEARDAIDLCIGQAARAGVDLGIIRYGGVLVHAQRNAVVGMMRKDADFLVMIDDDMIPEPMAILKLIANRVPVASALCTTRSKPAKLCLNVWNEERGVFIPVEWLSQEYKHSGHFAVGAAFLCLSRGVVTELVDQFLNADDWMEQNRKMFDRMEVSVLRRQKEQRRIAEIRQRYHREDPRGARVFNFDVLDGQEQVGEDIALGYRLKWLGHTVLIDPSIQVDHGGVYRYGLKDVPVPEDISKLVAA